MITRFARRARDYAGAWLDRLALRIAEQVAAVLNPTLVDIWRRLTTLESVHDWLASKGFTAKTYEEEVDEIEAEGPALAAGGDTGGESSADGGEPDEASDDEVDAVTDEDVGRLFAPNLSRSAA